MCCLIALQRLLVGYQLTELPSRPTLNHHSRMSMKTFQRCAFSFVCSTLSRCLSCIIISILQNHWKFSHRSRCLVCSKTGTFVCRRAKFFPLLMFIDWFMYRAGIYEIERKVSSASNQHLARGLPRARSKRGRGVAARKGKRGNCDLERAGVCDRREEFACVAGKRLSTRRFLSRIFTPALSYFCG